MPTESLSATAALVALSALGGLASGPVLAILAQKQFRGPMVLGRSARVAAAVATALLFVLVALRFGLQPPLLGYLVFAAAGVALSLIDMAEKRLPNAIVLPAAAAVAVLLIVASLVEGRPEAVLGVLLGAAGLFTLYLLLALMSRGQVGMGDVKFGLAAGAATGYLGLRIWLIGLVAGVVLNGLVALAALALRRTSVGGSVPFGPSIFVGAVAAVTLFA